MEYLVRDHSDITHVVHLAQDAQAQDLAVPRKKEDVSSGMMEALLEQLLKFPKTPHLVYASSYEVYNHLFPTNTNPVPFSEDQPITTPSSLLGAGKILDELVAKAYYEMHGVFSVGLRFFSVYGPWGVPGSPTFEMAERAVTNNGNDVYTLEESDVMQDVRDYVYIDDAVDAIMAAMQYRTPNGAPVVINVGTGNGTSLAKVEQDIQALFPSTNATKKQGGVNNKEPTSESATISYANTDRAKLLLGFEARVPLDEGLVRLLSWHYDRAFPYGGRPDSPSTNEEVTNKRNYIVSQGIASCSPFDKECMRGAPVFPCASECSHETKCTSSFYEDVLFFTRSLTSKCKTVMYSVDLDKGLKAIPSANMAISTHSSSHLEDGCNIAFVSESSELVQTLKKEQGFSLSITAVETFIKSSGGNAKPKVLKHGFWTMVPVSTPSFDTGDEHILDLLPKLSPGLFFGEATTHAIYCDPDVVFKDIPSLLQEANMQPYRAGTQGATAMLVSRKRPTKTAFGGDDSPAVVTVSESIQNAAYRMVRIGVIDDMSGDGYHPLLDSSWVVHTLQKEDSRLFRCDVFGEVVQWDVGTDEHAFEFIMGLHDMWSRVIVQDNGIEPWWIGDGVITVPETYGNVATVRSRRLEQVDDSDNEEEEAAGADQDEDNAEVAVEDVEVVEDAKARGDKGEQDDEEGTDDELMEQGDKVDEETDDEQMEQGEELDEETDDTKNEEAEEVVQDGGVNAADILEKDKDVVDDDDTADQDTDGEEDLDEKGEAFANEKDGDEAERVEKQAAGAEDAGDAAAEQGGEEAKGFLNAGNDRVDVAQGDGVDQNAEEVEKDQEDLDSQEEDDESDQEGVQAQAVLRQAESVPDRDHSSYDTWMGILSSTNVQYFVRIVPSSEVGATYLEDYKY